MKKNRLPLLSLLLLLVPTVANAWDRGPAFGIYVDPRIGSEGLGRVVVGPSCPFGMVKPSPDCTVKPNSGWLPMPAPVNGFSQTHVSGTGGGPKYGNVLIQPFCSGMDQISHPMLRKDEDISLAYYGTTFENGIRVEVTTAERASQYCITYPSDSMQCLLIDAGWFLGEQNKPDAREAQNFVGSQIQIVSETEVQGYTRIRAGWNEGRAYTVYFSAQFDRPITQFKTWSAPAAEYADKMDEELRKTIISDSPYQVDNQRKTGALLRFNPSDTSSAQSSSSEQTTLNVKIGISFISELKARQNAKEQIPHWDFDQTRQACIDKWEALLSKIEIGDSSKKAQPITDLQRRQFYTAIYHTLLEPVAGRFQTLRSPRGYTAIVDYAHTPDALVNVLDTIREVVGTGGHIITVCGCGGDRDSGKRPIMAREAAVRSDRVILTSDNPRTEDPEMILRDMEKGLPDDARPRTLTITDRRQAIRTACQLAQSGDVVLVAGKGHEDYQEIQGVKHHFDDREEVEAVFANENV